MTVPLILLSQARSLIILALYPDLDEGTRKQFSGPALFHTALAQAETQGQRVQQQLDDLIAHKTLDEAAGV